MVLCFELFCLLWLLDFDKTSLNSQVVLQWKFREQIGTSWSTKWQKNNWKKALDFGFTSCYILTFCMKQNKPGEKATLCGNIVSCLIDCFRFTLVHFCPHSPWQGTERDIVFKISQADCFLWAWLKPLDRQADWSWGGGGWESKYKCVSVF